jgi:GT2 family glycosyltransferase
MARYGQAMPCNWSAASASLGIGNVVPMHYLVADAQNLGCEDVVKKNFEWLLLWEDDVIAPHDALLQLNQYIRKAEIPVVSGLYFTKSLYSEPVLYRGVGCGCYRNFKLGQKVWADGVPTGFLLIHSSIIKLMWKESEEYETLGKRKTRKIFETVAQCYYDPETQSFSSGSGTSDLMWCLRVIKEDVLRRAGWPKIGRRKYPFLCDTKIFCKHVDLSTGKQFPSFDYNAAVNV